MTSSHLIDAGSWLTQLAQASPAAARAALDVHRRGAEAGALCGRARNAAMRQDPISALLYRHRDFDTRAASLYFVQFQIWCL